MAGRAVVEDVEPGSAMQIHAGKESLDCMSCSRVLHHASVKTVLMQECDLREDCGKIPVAGDPREFQHEAGTVIPAEYHGSRYLFAYEPVLPVRSRHAGMTWQDKRRFKTNAGTAFLHSHGCGFRCISINGKGRGDCDSIRIPSGDCWCRIFRECSSPSAA